MLPKKKETMKKTILSAAILTLLTTSTVTAENLAWHGHLGQDIEVQIELQYDDYGFVAGQTTYFRKSGKTSVIPFAGYRRYDDGRWDFSLVEHVGTKQCGFYEFTIDADDHLLGGFWAFGTRSYDFMEMLPVSCNRTFLQPAIYGEAEGFYRFTVKSNNPEMPEYGGHADIHFEHKYISYHFAQVCPNIAETYGTEAEVYGNTYYVSVPLDDDSGYSANYHVGNFSDFVIVKRENPERGLPEAFGAHTDIQGIYFRVNDESIDDEEVLSAYDEEISFGQSLPTTVFDLNEAWIEQIGGFTTYPDELIVRDIDGDGSPEVIAHYTEDRTSLYDVAGHIWAVFSCLDGAPQLLAYGRSGESYLSLDLAHAWLIVERNNDDNDGMSTYYYKMSDSRIVMSAARVGETVYLIDDSPVSEETLQLNIEDVDDPIPASMLEGWREIPGNVYRNEHAARG